MKMRSREQFGAVIPTASMADIAFLLIIFFMVTIQFEVDKTQVTVPKTTIRKEIPKKSAYTSVTNAGLIKVSSGEEVSTPVPSVEDVQSFAVQVVAANPNKAFVLKADEKVAYEIIDRIIDSLKQAKVKTIYLLSEQKTVEQTSG